MNPTPAPLPEEISRYYQESAEEDRLTAGSSQLEFERTKDVIGRYMAPPPGTVLDIGGAAGAYSLWLPERGYEVHLVDAAPRLVDEAARRSARAQHPIRTCQVGDARDMPFDGGVADAVLLLGPLYHLTTETDRLVALRETHRVLRRGGQLFVAAISRFASALDGIARDWYADPAFERIVRTDLETGQHRNETGQPGYWTTAYFHRPDQLRAEVTTAGFRSEALLGLEGPGWIMPDFDERWADTRKRDDMMRVARAIEGEPSIVGLSAHLLAVGIKE